MLATVSLLWLFIGVVILVGIVWMLLSVRS